MSGARMSGRKRFSTRDLMMIAGGVILALALVFVRARWMGDAADPDAADEAPSEAAAAQANDVRVAHDVLAAAGIQTAVVTARPMIERIETTGVVEADEQRIQEVTPLIAGRVERVSVSLGDPVTAGTVLLTLSSPQIAELQGNLRSQEAALAEAQATLNRTRRLVELGSGAGKDLVAAEAAYQTAQAQVAQMRESLEALGATGSQGATGTVIVRSPMTGRVLARTVNPAAWIEAGKSVMTIADLRSVWVIANVPEARLGAIRRGLRADLRVPSEAAALVGRITYIDPQLDQDTRSARVRVEVANASEMLRIGMFVDVTIEGVASADRKELAVPAEAVQRVGERSIVFVPTDDPERFSVRDVDVGDEVQNTRIIRQGLAADERVVTAGAFTLKSQLLKGQLAEDTD